MAFVGIEQRYEVQSARSAGLPKGNIVAVGVGNSDTKFLQAQVKRSGSFY
jgi:hypothetical protein